MDVEDEEVEVVDEAVVEEAIGARCVMRPEMGALSCCLYGFDDKSPGARISATGWSSVTLLPSFTSHDTRCPPRNSFADTANVPCMLSGFSCKGTLNTYEYNDPNGAAYRVYSMQAKNLPNNGGREKTCKHVSKLN